MIRLLLRQLEAESTVVCLTRTSRYQSRSWGGAHWYLFFQHNPGSLCTQYLNTPQIHFSLAGKSIALIGNLSNKMGKFSLIKINVTFICLFPYVKDKVTMDDSLNHGDDLPKESLSERDWNDCEEPIVVTLIPNFFITYFGQVLPHGDIIDNKIKAKLIRLGTGMNYGPILPTMPSRNWTTSLVSWRKSNLRSPSRSTLTQIGMQSPSLLPHQTASSAQWP